MKKFILVALSAALMSTAAGASTFIGSWQVDAGPNWPTQPAAYTGQEAAAFLFGGLAANYVISTVDSNPLHVDGLTWVSTWGGACSGTSPCGTTVADTFKVSTGGNYVNLGDTSAYVRDWARGAQYTNYAFSTGAVPEPTSWALLVGGFGLVGATLRRRRTPVVAA